MRPDKTAMLIGLAMKAGKIAGGETAAEAALRRREAQLVILSEDASPNTTKKFTDLARRHQVPVCRVFGKTELGTAVGRGERSCLTVTDSGFAEMIWKQINGDQEFPNHTER